MTYVLHITQEVLGSGFFQFLTNEILSLIPNLECFGTSDIIVFNVD